MTDRPDPFTAALDALDLYLLSGSDEDREALREALKADLLREIRRDRRGVEIVG